MDPATPPLLARIDEALRGALSPSRLEIRDDSARHAGHAGAASGGGHFSLTIESARFRGRTLLEQHRMVHEALAGMMGREIHAVAIRTSAPAAGPLESSLARDGVVLLDGAVGTELQRRGIATTLPLWSARALFDAAGTETLAAIHADYARAGAEILVTNTFRTTARALEKAGRASSWRAVNEAAVLAARRGAAASGGACLVAGGLAPLEDCYRPDLVPPQAACAAEHRRQAALLVELGVDLIFIETMNSGREARAALAAARAEGADVLISLCPRLPSNLLSGEPLASIVPGLIEAAGPRLRGILLNCAPPETLEPIFPLFARLADPLPHGVYAHLGRADDVEGWVLPEEHDPASYAAWIDARVREGARLVGGCCGTTPAHIAALGDRRRASGRGAAPRP